MRLSANIKTSTYNWIFISVLLPPLFVVFILNYIVDPFNKNLLFDLELPKKTVSYLMNYQLYKILEYSQNPKSFIVLGDSRAESLKAKYFSENGVKNFYNFAYGGGTLFEAIDTFWFASKQTKLSKVIIGLPFNLYNSSNRKNRFPGALEVGQDSFSYYLSPLVTKASFYNILTSITGKRYKTERPPMSKEQFWQHQLERASITYRRWSKPNLLYKKLVELSNYCRDNNIELIFFLPPTHKELQDKIIEHNLSEDYSLYKKELQKLGDVFDFDYNNSDTVKKDNFKDPYHFNAEFTRKIVKELIYPTKSLGKFLPYVKQKIGRWL